MQYLEAPDATVLPDAGPYDANCDSWKDYYASAYYLKSDSGL